LRKVTFGGANSLDNYLARPDHAVDWLKWSKEAAAVMTDYWKTIDTVLMGREVTKLAALPRNPDDDAVFWGTAADATAARMPAAASTATTAATLHLTLRFDSPNILSPSQGRFRTSGVPVPPEFIGGRTTHLRSPYVRGSGPPGPMLAA